MLKSKFSFSLILFSILFAVSASTSNAEQSALGRQSDGRAYRVDSNGFRIVDELAELEVRNKDLEEQVLRLQKKLADTPA